MIRSAKPVLSAAAGLLAGFVTPEGAKAGELSWEKLAPLPTEEGFAGGFAGVASGVLLFGGGTNFADRPPWEGGQRTWHRHLYALKSPDSSWIRVGELPRAIGYGASVSVSEGLVLLGGADAQRHYADVWLVRWDGATARFEALPDLPRPNAYSNAVLLGRVIFLASGIATPVEQTSEKALWQFDLDDAESGWKALPPWPGSARVMAPMAVIGREILIFSGKSVDPTTPSECAYLTDGWAFNTETGIWRNLAPIPFPASAVPSPAPITSDGRMLVLGGNDGELARIPPGPERPNFPQETMIFDPHANSWTRGAALPFAQKVTPVVRWNDKWVVVSGELQPGIRTLSAWAGGEASKASADSELK